MAIPFLLALAVVTLLAFLLAIGCFTFRTALLTLALDPPRAVRVEDWNAAELFPPSPTVERVQDLVAQVRARFRDLRSTTDPREEAETIENLRLLICVRMLQGRPDGEVLAELVSIGLVEDYAADLIWSTQSAGRARQLPLPPPVVPRGLAAYWMRPRVPSRQRIDLRAARRLEEARILAGIAGEGDPEILREVESIPLMPPLVMQPNLLRFMLLVGLIFLCIVAFVIVLVLRSSL